MKNLFSVIFSRNVALCSLSKRTSFFSFLVAALLGLNLLPTSQVFAADKPSAKTEILKQKSVAKVSINRASVEDLTNLKGIGEKKAIAIVKYRDENGKFKSLEQLAEVKGIGLSIIEQNRDLLTL